MAKPSRNGVAERMRHKTPRDAKSLIKREHSGRTAVGNAPKDFSPSERKAWDTIIKECPWGDSTHRGWLRGYAVSVARVDDITDYFRKRKAEFAKRGEDVALAYLDDNGKRHQLMTDLFTAEAGLRKALSDIGASPASQVRMMSDMGVEKTSAKEEEAQLRYFR